MNAENDKVLVDLAIAGDRQAFEALIEKYYDMMYDLAFKWCGRREDAEDIAHIAFLKIADNIRRFRGDSSIKTWIYRIVINVANDWHRQNKVRRHSSLEPEQVQSSDKTDQNIRALEIIDKVNELPEGLREVIILVSGQGLSHAEAADILGIKEKTVSWRLHEARKHLADMLRR
jgi:RNA polymerase sigma-70 factor (ECF subfamily)